MYKLSLKNTILVLLLVLLNNVAFAQTTFYDNYAFRIPLTLNNASLSISTDQTNFVALLKVTSPQFVSGVCTDKVGGSVSIPPFAIIDSAYSTTTELNYQIENYDPATGIIYFWVKVPTLYKTGSVNGSNKFYCYFGSSSPSVTHNTAWQKLTWSGVTATAGINYSGVWHFNEDPSGTAPQFSDATVNNNNLSSVSSGTVTQNSSSQIGNGITLSSTSVLDIGTTAMPNSEASQSLSIWASYPTITSSITAENLIVLENSTNPASSGNGTQLGVLVDKTTPANSTLQTWRWANRLTPLVKYTPPPTANAWHHYVYTYNKTGNVSNLYVDGALIAGPTTTYTPISGTVDMVSFGDYINNNIGGSGLHTVGGQSFTGTMDESHVIGATLSADWVKAEYVNQKNPDAFTTAGAMQTNSLRASATAGYLSYSWKGVSTNITNANNWDNTTANITNEVPVNTNVNWVIPSGKSYYPVLTANAGVYALTIADGAYINLNGNTLSVGCNIYNNTTTGGTGILNASNTASGVNWNGSISAQGYYGTNVKNTAEIGNMTVNNSSAGTVTITGGPVDIYNTLTITKGNLVIDNTGNGDLTLKSSSTITASVAAIPSAYSITGLVNTERYITGGAFKYRGYRFLSSPVYTAKVGSNYYFDLSYLSSYTPITGTLGISGGMNKTGNPTIYLYRGDIKFTNGSYNGGNFRGINKINNSPLYSVGVDYDGNFNLYVGNGFWFFYRGNTTNIATKYLTNTVPESNVFVSRGTLNQQTVTFTHWYTNAQTLQYAVVAGNAPAYVGYNMVGNPYASSIDWDTFSASTSTAGIYGPQVNKTIYIYNETTKIWGTYDGTSSLNGASHIIPSGQGFYVQAKDATAQLIFHESAKTGAQVTGANLLLSKKPVNSGAALQYVRLQMLKDSDNVEEAVIRFENTAKNKYVIDEDSRHMAGTGGVNFSSYTSDNITASINVIPLPKKSQTTIRLYVSAPADGLFKLEKTEQKNIPDLYEIWLKDAYKKDSLDLRNNPVYQFNILRNDTNSWGANRFSLVIRQNKALSLHLLNFTAAKTTKGAELVWKTENEQNLTNFTIERSTDNGKTFDVVGGYVSGSEGTYSLLDKNPPVATDLYRLKLEDLNGAITYSNVIALRYSTSSDNADNSAVNIYPNPAVNSINVSIVKNSITVINAPNPSYSIKITNSTGKILKTINTAQDTWQDNINYLLPGTYIIDVTNNSDNTKVGQGKFVKL
jgi:hypothetical protein